MNRCYQLFIYRIPFYFKLLILTLSQQACASTFELHIESEKDTYEQGSFPLITAYIINSSEESVNLVKPGDGSQSQWRTPMTATSVIPVEGELKHPDKLLVSTNFVCGNINALKTGEVFTISSGEKYEIDMWRSETPLRKLVPGKYRVVFYYSNLPALEWKGIPLGTHDETEMKLLKGSQKIELVSNELVLTVVESSKFRGAEGGSGSEEINP